ncbi:tetratricopeptide repeat protein [Amycolatopsis roodepoortensis]|uniref:Tetratricopeptide (TPR) repeat protein n=1 Tax=Amycolatopsis roodepoortensis TaxID=700274 RepID=A0ABR9LDX1_9PSEU|nr:tetratricopeptide repeat protein [Amycolatopsis roodepoortensis]MBE1578854.1 tetratricopeptide (TPR) repeat protein [Amycolatopsis roodepoortensis]
MTAPADLGVPANRPWQIPAAPAVFEARERFTAELDRLWHDGTGRRLVVVSGVGGVGKTSLALDWLDRRSDEFPHGILYSDLGGAREQPPEDPGEVLHGFLTALGSSPAEIPSSLDQRAAAFRTATASRRMAMLLDDAASVAQVRPLLPAGQETVVVVTSRWRLTDLGIDGAQFVDLPPLTDSQARALFERYTGTERLRSDPPAATEIVSSCGGLPLALSVAAARLRTRPRRTLAREAAAYGRWTSTGGSSTDKALSLNAIFEVVYEGLPQSAARVYLACGVHPGPFVSTEPLAAALGRPVGSVEDDVDELIEANLLTETGEDRFVQHMVLHSDARARARTALPGDEQERLGRSFAGWYLDRVLAADEAIHPHRTRYATRARRSKDFVERADGLAWWREHLSVIRAVFSEAAEHDWDDIVWQFCEASWGYFLHHRDYRPWIAMNERGVLAATRADLPLVQARLRSQLGYAYAKVGRYDKATEQNLIALRLGQQENDGPTQATALSQLGRSARGRGDLDGALDFYRQAADLQERLGIPRGVALCRRRQGEVLSELGRYSEAMIELTAAATVMAGIGDAAQHARSAMALARIQAAEGRAEDAIGRLTESLRTVRALDSPYYTAEILTALGNIELQSGREQEGAGHLAEAQALYADGGDAHTGAPGDGTQP